MFENTCILRFFIKQIFAFVVFTHIVLSQNFILTDSNATKRLWPLVGMTYRQVNSLEHDFEDLKNHGVDLVELKEFKTGDIENISEYLQIARKYQMKYILLFGTTLLPNIEMVKSAGFEPEPALMIGGVYNGKAIDRHVFSFTPTNHKIIIEPPVYNSEFAYTGKISKEPVAHYYNNIGDPIKAEIIVPLKNFDGSQHLKIISADIKKVIGNKRLKYDSVNDSMQQSYEIKNRSLYEISFDLSSYKDAILDKIGISVYWEYLGSNEWYLLNWGNVSMASENTRRALKVQLEKVLNPWIKANNNSFPDDVIWGVRFGDETFYLTGHASGKNASVNYPLWDYSKSSIDRFKMVAGELHYPRTWGYPEIYGKDAYGLWLYNLHQICAETVGIVKNLAKQYSTELKIIRNITRRGVFSVSNDFDGSGGELLTQNLDIVHIDPYPVTVNGFRHDIPRDMSYFSGLARRYNKLLIPWLQAHKYGSLKHVTPEDVDKMTTQHWEQGVDGVMWLGYGPSSTFPNIDKASWERAKVFHQKIKNNIPPKPQVSLAVMRSYKQRALTSFVDGDSIRNYADWMLQQWLEVWAVKHGQPYDVFEIPPIISSADSIKLEQNLKKYSYIVSTEEWQNSWVVGKGTECMVVSSSSSVLLQEQFEQEMYKRGWLKK